VFTLGDFFEVIPKKWNVAHIRQFDLLWRKYTLKKTVWGAARMPPLVSELKEK
jgi:hypothetical protein